MRQSSAFVGLGVMLGLLAGASGLTALAQDTAPLAFDVAAVKQGLLPSWSRGVQVWFPDDSRPPTSLSCR